MVLLRKRVEKMMYGYIKNYYNSKNDNEYGANLFLPYSGKIFKIDMNIEMNNRLDHKDHGYIILLLHYPNNHKIQQRSFNFKDVSQGLEYTNTKAPSRYGYILNGEYVIDPIFV